MLGAHVSSRQGSQLGIHEWRELLQRTLVSLAPGLQQARDVDKICLSHDDIVVPTCSQPGSCLASGIGLRSTRRTDVRRTLPAVSLMLPRTEGRVSFTPERWQHIARIYELAIDREAGTPLTRSSPRPARARGIAARSGVVARQEAAKVVVDRPMCATAALLFDDGPDLQPGATLGPYVARALGAGGMGEVSAAPTPVSIVRR